MRKNGPEERWWQVLPTACVLLAMVIGRVADVRLPPWVVVVALVTALIVTAFTGTLRDFVLRRR